MNIPRGMRGGKAAATEAEDIAGANNVPQLIEEVRGMLLQSKRCALTQYWTKSGHSLAASAVQAHLQEMLGASFIHVCATRPASPRRTRNVYTLERHAAKAR